MHISVSIIVSLAFVLSHRKCMPVFNVAMTQAAAISILVDFLLLQNSMMYLHICVYVPLSM